MQKVRLYDGHLAKSGKSIIEFGGHKLSHCSKVADKSDLLVYNESKVILRSYPAKTERAIVLNDLATQIPKLEHYLKHPESFEVVDVKILLGKASIEAEDTLEIDSMPREPSYSRSGNYAHLNKDHDKHSQTFIDALNNRDEPIEKKKYNQKEFRW